jgi:hypothetical protein
MPLKFVKPERIWLANHPEYRETWVQQRIAEDPSILGLGDLVLKDKERSQPRAGRLDLLLQDAESSTRYEVEVMLGSTDESHIIRTIEYWDVERKRYPQYDHYAVIITEDITSRFLNVIGLFNGFIPLIALQMSAWNFGDQISLVFTKVVDALTLGMPEEDEEVQAVTDRNYWENRGTKQTVALADEMLELVKTFAPELELKYNKFYIGLARDGQPSICASLRMRKSTTTIAPRCAVSSTATSTRYFVRVSRFRLAARRTARLRSPITVRCPTSWCSTSGCARDGRPTGCGSSRSPQFERRSKSGFAHCGGRRKIRRASRRKPCAPSGT